MASVTIREISTEATTVNNDDLVEIDQGSASKKLSFSTIISWIKSVFESGNDLIVGDWVNGGYVGDVVPVIGNVQEPSADRPRLCITNFAKGTAKTINNARWPDITAPSGATIDGLVSTYRGRQLRYLDGYASGEESSWSGTVSGTTLTLATSTAVEQLMAAIAEFRADYGTYTDFLTVTVDDVEYEIQSLDATALEIELPSAIGDGAVTVKFFPHRIAGSTTTARVHSAVGKDIRGAGTVEYLAGLMWRDQMQQITASVWGIRSTALNTGVGAFDGSFQSGFTAPPETTAGEKSDAFLRFDSAKSSQARTGTTTRGAGMGMTLEVHGGKYVPAA